MALSNWDTLVLDHKGNPSRGDLISPMGITVEVHKNWLYLRDPQAWRPGQFVEPTVMEIQEGSIHYLDVHVFARRGPAYGIYFSVWTGNEGKEGFSAMAGIGCSGYVEEKYVGVLPEYIQYLQALLREEDVPEVLKTLDFSHALRFNQGDAYFTDRFNKDVPATRPGKAEPTILSEVIKNYE